MANRLKPVMPKLVGVDQTSFIPNRHASDNIVLVQELIHSMKKKTGKKGYITVKVDLEKAYDRIRWDFLEKSFGGSRIRSKYDGISYVLCMFYRAAVL